MRDRDRNESVSNERMRERERDESVRRELIE